MEGENRLRGDPAARSWSAAEAEEALFGGEKGQCPSAPSKPRLRRRDSLRARGWQVDGLACVLNKSRDANTCFRGVLNLVFLDSELCYTESNN